MIKGVIFDMDGVLVDNSPVHIEAFDLWCRSRKMDCPMEKLEAMFGMGNDEIFRGLFDDPSLSDELIAIYAEEKEQIYRDLISKNIKPLDGLIDILNGLRERGLKIAVGSSGMTKNVNFVLEKCGITQYFDAISNGDMVTRAKPDPEVFLLAASLLKLEPSECIVFEDSFAGTKAARAAGMKVVAVATTYPREQHTDNDGLIDDFTQITVDQIVNL